MRGSILGLMLIIVRMLLLSLGMSMITIGRASNLFYSIFVVFVFVHIAHKEDD